MISQHKTRMRHPSSGFTLIELILVIVISGILVSTAMRSGQQLFDTAKVETTKTEMDLIAIAIVGDPTLHNANTPASFGYVGDVGALPANLDNLITNPGSYASWNGPYVENDFVQNTTDYKKDAWGTDYIFSGGLTISSTGSGNTLTRTLASKTADLLQNRVTGLIANLSGRPPGASYNDSLEVKITIPNGTGGYQTKTATPDLGGYFKFDSIPIGNHDLTVIYLPTNDTLSRFVTILPNSSVYDEYRFTFSSWTSTGGGSGSIEYVGGSAKTETGNCDRIEFDITNTSGATITVTTMLVSWSSPTAYYEKVKFDGGSHVFNQSSPRAGSGDVITFSSSKNFAAGTTVTIRIEKFTDVSSGNGSNVNMSNTDLTVTFSDGSTITFNTGAC